MWWWKFNRKKKPKEELEYNFEVNDKIYYQNHKPFHNRTLTKNGNCFSCDIRYGNPFFVHYGDTQEEWENGKEMAENDLRKTNPHEQPPQNHILD